MSTWRRVLLVTALVAAVGEALDSISVGWVGLAMAALFSLGALLIVRGGRSGVILWESRRADARPAREPG